MKRVYVAGKLNDMAVDYLHNVHRMMETAEEVRKVGAAPFVPAIDLLMGIKFGYTDYHDYFNLGQAWLEAADAVVLTPGFETSKGTYEELQTAMKLNIPIYVTVDDFSNEKNSVRDIWATAKTVDGQKNIKFQVLREDDYVKR